MSFLLISPTDEIAVRDIHYTVFARTAMENVSNMPFTVAVPNGGVPGIDGDVWLELADAFAETVRAAVDLAHTAGDATLFRAFIPEGLASIDQTDITP